MDTRYIETLLTVARRGSFAGAAHQLNLTATAVAQRIRALEEEFGVRLVTRSGRTVRPTEAGYAVLTRSEQFLREYRSLRAAVAGTVMGGRLRLGAISTVLTGLLPEVLSKLATDHPDLHLFVEPGSSSELYDRVQAGYLDAAAIIRPAFELPKGWEFRSWRRDPLVLLVPKSERRTDVAAILNDWHYIRYDRQQWGGRLPQIWLDAHSLEPDIRYEMDALDVIAVLVGRGLGVSIVPDWVGPWPEGIKLNRIPLPEPCPQREIGFIWPRNSPQTHLLRLVAKAAQI